MKLSTSVLSVALLASSSSASPLEAGQAKRAADNCLRAVRGTPSIGLPFCSSALTILPVTSTSYVEAPTVTVVISTTETASTTLTTTTGTETVTTTAGAGQKQKRRTDPTANILNQCGNNMSRVSSACSEFFVGVPTSTTTVVATTTPTFITTAVATETETSTVETVAVTTVTTQPAPTGPAFVNPGFDLDPHAPTGWQINVVLPCSNCVGNVQAVGTVQSTYFVSAPNAFQASMSPSETGRLGVSQTISLVVGKQYAFSFSFFQLSPENARYELWINFALFATITPRSASWSTWTSNTYTATQALARVEVRMRTVSASGETVNFYIDDVGVAEVITF